ncbi:unnamed protein product [Pipistrellus nathusii]|uniref:Uncharacterized protein n=1 Tax=Pipistrellus nathusii TaxID=59473 RepID=A0ABP0AFQ8_PIPNA
MNRRDFSQFSLRIQVQGGTPVISAPTAPPAGHSSHQRRRDPLFNAGAPRWCSIFRDQSSLKCRPCSQRLRARACNLSGPVRNPAPTLVLWASAYPCQASPSQL